MDPHLSRLVSPVTIVCYNVCMIVALMSKKKTLLESPQAFSEACNNSIYDMETKCPVTEQCKKEVLNTFRSNLLKKFEHLCEGTATQRNPTLLNEIYTELYITESESGEISNEHEVRQIETQSRRAATEDTAINILQ
ncbi:hypothetical protein cypCar_00044570 [Cyprinus carpio]|nr:hypothetical protein cypCar_00044570 [Cyprinus carpio]